MMKELFRIIIFPLLLFVVSCDKPAETNEMEGSWSYVNSQSDIFLTSQITQTVIQPFVEDGMGVPVSGKYSGELFSLLIAVDETTNSRILLLHSGRFWFGGEHQLAIIEAPDTAWCQYLYNHREEYSEDSTEAFTSQSIDYSFNFETGHFQVHNCILYSETGQGQVEISGEIHFPTITVSPGESKLFRSSISSTDDSDIEKIIFESNNSVCIDHFEHSMEADGCGQWSQLGDSISLDIENILDATYWYEIDNDILMIEDYVDCEDASEGENFLYISEYPDQLGDVCFHYRHLFMKE